MEHATVVVSGTKIAQEISSNRSEVWRLIQQLRGLGVDVAGHPATGYQLRAVPDLLLPEILRPLVRGTIFDTHLHHFYKIGSTNTEAWMVFFFTQTRLKRLCAYAVDTRGSSGSPAHEVVRPRWSEMPSPQSGRRRAERGLVCKKTLNL